MGEETDGVIESTSKLQEKIKALSGVDILTDSGDYKDTYTILREIGEVWEEMSDIDQAALLELMAGKNRANTLSAILGNMEDLEGAYNDALNAEGSALKENEAYLDSIQGRIDLFKNSVQTMWMNFISADAVKFVVDLGTALIKLVDAFGLIPTAVGLFAGYKMAAKDIKAIFDETASASEAVTAAKQKEAAAKMQSAAADVQETATSTANAAANIAEANASEQVQQEKLEEATSITAAAGADQLEGQMSLFAADSDSTEAAASAMVSSADQLEGQMSLFAAESDNIEAAASKNSEAADVAEAAASIMASSADQLEGQMSFFDGGSSTAGGGGLFAGIISGGKTAGSVLKVLGSTLLKTVGIMAAVSAASWVLGKAWEWVDDTIHHVENLKSEVEDLKKTYDSTKQTIDSNLKILTTSSDTDTYETLQDEFNHLAQGVDKYGNNISLTTDQYERYKQICEQIVDINPSIAAGYDNAAEAIGDNVDVLSELIELQKYQARQNVEELISDENFGKLAKDAKNDLDSARRNQGTTNYNAGQDLFNVFADVEDYKDLNQNGLWQDDVMRNVLKQLGYNAEEINKEVQKYYQNAMGHNQYDYTGFFNDHAAEIKANASKFGNEYQQILNDTFGDIEKAIRTSDDDIKKAQDGLIDDFLLVPQGEDAGEAYDSLNDASKKFITDWIKNSSQFKVDANQTEEAAIANRDKIIEMVKNLASEDFTTEFKGEQITGQDLLDQLYNFDPSTVDWQTYQNQILDYVNTIWDLIGGKDNEYGFTDKNELMVSLGFNFVADNQELVKDRNLIAERLKMTTDEMNEFLAGMTAAEIQAFYQIDWNDIDPENSDTKTEIMDIIHKKMMSVQDSIPVQTYSVLVSAVENYNDIQSQTEEIVSDNTGITQEYKDSLIALGISTEELNECFDEDNKLIVKNAALLRKLVAQKKQEQKATVNMAKSNSQLQYKNTVQQLQQVIKAMALEVKASGFVSSATLQTIDILRSQLTALKQTIQQYALLELSLTDAANAYSEFELAKQRDSELTYGDSMVEMLQAINDGFKTGQVGSEAFQAAVKALVPPEVYENIDNVQERMQAIHDYIDKDSVFADYFTIDENGIAITMDNIKAFLQDGLDDGLGENFGVFTGTIEDFDLAPHIQSIEDLAAAYGITEAAALAMLTEFEKYDASWGDIITRLTTTELDRNINDATTSLEEALTAQEEFIKSGQPLYDEDGNMTEGYKAITDAVNEAQEALDSATQKAADNAQTYTQVEAVLMGMTGQVKYTQEQADALARSLDLVNENGECTITIDDQGNLQLTQSQIDTLNERLTGLEKPTILDVQLAYDNIDRQLNELTTYLDNPANYSGTILTELNITNEEEAKAKVDELTADRDAIQLIYNITTTSAEQSNGNIEKLTAWEANGINITITGDSSNLSTAISEANALEMEDKESKLNGDPTDAIADIDLVNAKKLDDKESTISMQGVSVALTDIYSIDDALAALPSTKNIDVNVNYNTAGSILGGILSGFGSADGNFHISGDAFAGGTIGAPRTETSLVGELGPEILVRNGRWTTVGENGAEFTEVKKGDIIFNHKQTEQLLKNGYVTGRGKAYSSGTAYGFGIYDAYVGDGDVFKNGSDEWVDPYTNVSDDLNNAADALSNAADDVSNAADEFKEVFDWIEVRVEELDETLSLLNAQLENATNYSAKNNIIDKIIGTNRTKMADLKAGIEEYAEYASKLLAEVPEKYREAAQDGAIAITQFAGETDEKTLEAIENYREWAQKVADLKQQLEEIKIEIRDLAMQKFDNIYEAGDVRVTVEDSQTEKLQNVVDLIEESGEIATEAYYHAMMENSNKTIEYLTKTRDEMQRALDEAVEAGIIVRGSNEWYEMIDQLYQVDAEIDEATIELEEFQNAINDIYWDNFDELINRIEYLKDETQSLIDLMDSDDMVIDPEKRTYEGGTVEYWTADDVKWTDEGLASLGLYAQQMEIAEYEAKQYAKAIDDLNKDYADGKYSESEYLEKLNELKDAQYESIEAYYDAQDAIKDLNEIRIDSIKEGIEKEIEAYEELIQKKKEALDADKDMHDFQKSIMEQQKNISDIERKLAALSADNSISAVAQRKKLEAELAEARAELEESYYDRSIEDQQNALDKELENFQESKDEEITKWEEYLENIEQVVADSLTVVQANASGIYDTLNAKATEYDLTLSEAIMSPWQDGSLAVSDYQETFDSAMSSTMNQLDELKNKWQEVIDKMAEAGNVNVDTANKENADYASATYKEPAKPAKSETSNASQSDEIEVGDLIDAGDAKICTDSKGSNPSTQYYSTDPIYAVVDERNGYVAVRHRSRSSGVSGWFKHSQIRKYAKGTLGVKEDQLALIDELGDELRLIPDGHGRLSYMKKGTGIIPADLTANLMEWGTIDPTDMLERSKPQIGVSPSVVNNTTEIHIDASVGELIHVEHLDGNNPAELTKIVDKAWDKRMKELNAHIRRYTNR